MKPWLIIVVSCIWTVGYVFAAETIEDSSYQVLYVTEGDFQEVKENLELAISGQGLVINNVATVGEMLEKTGKDLGATRQIYVHGDVIEFCSASLSREMSEADPANIVFCPYTIQIYEVPEQPGNVFVGYRRPPIVGNDRSKAALTKVDALLHAIVNEALAW
ncbi:MAG: DUF302 domain-containing protein [Gammaproteobacteria bacterium]|nr:DUF302 domain-containing protein [Gammaproteobacteria bacterium]